MSKKKKTDMNAMDNNNNPVISPPPFDANNPFTDANNPPPMSFDGQPMGNPQFGIFFF